MELLILLIVIAFLAGLILGPAGFFKAQQAGQKIASLEHQVKRLSIDLREVRSLYFKLRETVHPKGFKPETSPGAGSLAAAEDVLPEQREEQTTQEADEPVIEEVIAEPASTLERISELKENQDQAEPAVEGSAAHIPDEAAAVPEFVAAVEPSTATEPVCEVQPLAEQKPATVAATRRLTIEEVLAGKVFVWVGAVALVLTAAFLLKLGFDSGVITEPVRVIAAGIFGVVLWCVGEWARSRVGLIAQALCGAAVAVLYATVLAGHNLYGLFGANGEMIAFSMMGLITGVAITLSLRHGPAVAILGMLGGFMLPPMLAQGFGGPSAGMVLYLLAIEIGVLAVTGKRGWFGISAMTLVFSVAWSLGYTLIGDHPAERTLTAFLVIGTAAAYIFQAARIHRDPETSKGLRQRVLGLSIAATCSAIGISALLAIQGEYAPRDLGMLWVVAAGTLILARLDARQIAMPFVAMALSLLVLFTRAAVSLPDPPTDTAITIGACFGGLFLIGGYVFMCTSPHRRLFAVMTAIAGPCFYGLVVFAGSEAFGVRDAWWPYTLSLAGLYALGSVPMLLKRKAEHDWPIALFAALSFVLVCVTLMQVLDHPRLAVSLALAAAVGALVDLKLYIRPLRVAACGAAVVSAVLLVVPGPFDIEIGKTVIFNNLLPMYLLPAIAFGVIAWCAAKAGSSGTARRMINLCCATIAALLFVLTRHAFHPYDFMHEGFVLFEWATVGCVLLLASMVGLVAAKQFKLEAVRNSAVVTAGLGAVIAVIGGFGPSNPLFDPGVYGSPWLVLQMFGLYIAPAVLMWLWSRHASTTSDSTLKPAMQMGSITLIAVFVALQVRNAFHPGDLNAVLVTPYECATYGLAWVALGCALHFFSARSGLPQVTGQSGRTVFGMGLAVLLLGNVLILNPLWHRASVGVIPAFNGLWYLFGPTILILVLLARHARRHDRPQQAKLAGFTAIALAFMLLSMFVRHGFSGDGLVLLAGSLSSAERYAYSLVWVLFGGVLLVTGVLTRLDTLRYGSLAVLLLAVGKVFLIDTANLDNLYRVFSFFGLGVTLVGLGYLYQRLVFRRPRHTNGLQAS
ncbi:MAG: DUF2339 domain-containing protein [Planctomycetota bacterium]